MHEDDCRCVGAFLTHHLSVRLRFAQRGGGLQGESRGGGWGNLVPQGSLESRLCRGRNRRESGNDLPRCDVTATVHGADDSRAHTQIDDAFRSHYASGSDASEGADLLE